MIDTKNSILKQTQRLFAMEGIDIDITDEVIDWVVDEAHAKKLGARGLKTILEKELLDIQYELPTYKKQGVSKIHLNEYAIKNKAPFFTYEKIKTEKKN
jgi:ATP-dependent Clp protease ATP-binding subunit ClpX